MRSTRWFWFFQSVWLAAEADAVFGSSAHAAPWLRLCTGQCRPRNPRRRGAERYRSPKNEGPLAAAPFFPDRASPSTAASALPCTAQGRRHHDQVRNLRHALGKKKHESGHPAAALAVSVVFADGRLSSPSVSSAQSVQINLRSEEVGREGSDHLLGSGALFGLRQLQR